MKKLLGILTLVIMMSAPVWAWDDFSVTIGNRGASFWYKSGSAHWDNGIDDYNNSRQGRSERRTDKRIARIDRRLERQRIQIGNARKNGELTPKEFRRLRRDTHRIKNYRHAVLGDGWLSQREWRNLTTMLDRSSEQIYQLSNNRRTTEQKWGRSRRYARKW